MFKKSLLSFFLAIILLINVVSASAAAEYAYSIGTDYDAGLFDSDIDTSADATSAATDFSLAGYSSYYNTMPTYQYMRGNNPVGTPRMESSILFFSGHANYDNMAFNYQKKGGDYATGVYWDYNYDSSTTGYKYAGIKSYAMTKVKLITFGGCKTALGTDNIAKRAVNLGAKATVGWPESIAASSHSQWLSKYTDKLGTGGTVKQAVDYANSFSYSDSLVKNAIIYGDSALKIKIATATATSLSSTVAEPTLDQSKDGEAVKGNEDIELKIKQDELKRKKFISQEIKFDFNNLNYDQIADYIVDNIDKTFDLNNYNINLVNRKDGSGVIDLMQQVGEFKTTSGYTILIDDNKVQSVYNNKINKGINKTIKTVTQKQIDEAKKVALEQLSDDYTMINQSGLKFFDIEKEKFYYIVFTEYQVNGTNSLGKIAYYYEI
ncbi:MAG: hypothetical protein KGZ96_01520 [Clostridia bacterium]|nr:hypothetical protein [Clostridia bacterium]